MDEETSTEKHKRLDVPTLSGRIKTRFDVRCMEVVWYMLTSDQMDKLKGGAESLDFTYFGIFFAAGLTLIGLAIPMYVAGQTGRIFVVAVTLAVPLLILSARFFSKARKTRREVQDQVEKIQSESKTVLEYEFKEPE